jgi:integrase
VPTILTHITPHTLRRSYISFMLAAGYDVPYVQAQVGHEDPTTTLGIYARVIAQPDRDRLKRTMTELLRGTIERPRATDAPKLF